MKLAIDMRSPALGLALAVGAFAAAVRHSTVDRGRRNTALIVAAGVGLPAIGEFASVNVSRILRHNGRPRLWGVPVSALLGWFSITYASMCSAEQIVRTRSESGDRRIPLLTALVATSLDLLLDCFGLDQGLWEWRDGGRYAPEISGANGKQGIPLVNFAGWLGLTGLVSWVYGQLAPEWPRPVRRDSAPWLLLAYYVPALIWAITRKKWRYVLFSIAAPVAIAASRRTPSVS